MIHSHPRTFSLLTRLANKNELKLSVLNSDYLLKDLCVRIRLKIDSHDNKLIEIDIPHSLNDKGNNVKRISNCFSFWIPYCLEIFNIVKYSFSLCLNASDWEEANFLSMTSKDIGNIIPDEYAMFESKRLNKRKYWTSFDEFYKSWIKRKNTIYWRGSTTGSAITSVGSLQELQRIKVCLLYQNEPCFDLRISNIVNNILII